MQYKSGQTKEICSFEPKLANIVPGLNPGFTREFDFDDRISRLDFIMKISIQIPNFQVINLIRLPMGNVYAFVASLLAIFIQSINSIERRFEQNENIVQYFFKSH